MTTKDQLSETRGERLRLSIAPILVRMRLLSLLEAGLIDTSRIQDASYVRRQLLDDSLYDQAPTKMFVETEDNFLRAAQFLGKRGDKESAVILLFTAIEHVTNFYIRLFAEMQKNDPSSVAKMIAAPHPRKMSDILPSFGVKLPVGIKEKIIVLRSIRNRIVHFDQVPFIIHPRDEKPGSYDKLELELKGIVLRRFYGLPQALREHCEATYQQNHPQFDDMLTAARLLGAA